MSESYFEERKHRIVSDLASFADPGGVRVDEGIRRFQATWTMRSEPRDAVFRISPDRGITVTIDRQHQPYEAFLAGPGMADLRYVAQMTKRAGSAGIFIPTRARRSDQDNVTSLPATDLLTQILEGDHSEVTPVIMVTGEAGSGKTRVLQELVRRQAERYLDGQTGKLMLYVNAQGRALARLNEALATELQDLKVNLTYHSIATLTRVGILVPVIDGFDELLGVTGYDDAFNSLATFLEQLDGEGILIASARSAYYEEEFLSRAGQTSAKGTQAWSYVSIKIQPWADGDRKRFLAELAERESIPKSERDILNERVQHVFRNREELASKPLFVAKTVDLLRERPDFQVGDDLLSTLTKRFLEREQQEKLLDKNQQPLVSEQHLALLMSELAEEMWNQETRELDRDSVREIAEYVLRNGDLPESACQIVIQRMPTLAFLALGKKEGSVAFEHEVFFFNFLAHKIVSQCIQGTDMRVMLSRSTLPDFVADRVSYDLGRQDRMASLDDFRQILQRLTEAGKTEWRRMTQVRENSGTIILALLQGYAARNPTCPQISDCDVSTVIFPGGGLAGVTFRNCKFEDVVVRRTNLGTTRFLACQAIDVVLVEPRVSVNSTRLELQGLRIPDDILGIRELSDERDQTTYDPKEIIRILGECGANVGSRDVGTERNVSDAMLDLLQRMIRAYLRANPICDADPRLTNLFKDPQWPTLQEHLIEHGLVKAEVRHASGPSKKFLRRQFSTDQIMLGQSKSSRVDPRIGRFWDSLETIAS